ncbi:hypothetical protein VKT23_019508 [Stygiomarasmius scandens]|uniref:Uncharacterized protein n=1 Tax=Marasmiellus scandens TaxID=2682957 RepID=A0ABR1IP50_9AGAR
MWDAGIRFSVAAIDALKPSDFDPYLKLIMGITYRQEAWVHDAVQRIFFAGTKTKLSESKEPYSEYISAEGRHAIDWELRDGLELMERTISELIHHPPTYQTRMKTIGVCFSVTSTQTVLLQSIQNGAGSQENSQLFLMPIAGSGAFHTF